MIVARVCAFLSLILALGPGPGGMAAAQALPDLPSGQQVTLQEVLIDETMGEPWLRFRFVAPRIVRTGGDIDHAVAVVDIVHLCDEFALAYIAAYALTPARVVISLADSAVPFGTSQPDVTQYFDMFQIEDGRCVWEEF